MATNPLARKISLAATYAAVATAGMADVTIEAASDNAAVAYMLGDDGTSDVPIPKGVPFPIRSVDLAALKFKGSAGDSVIVIGSFFPIPSS